MQWDGKIIVLPAALSVFGRALQNYIMHYMNEIIMYG